MKHVPAHTRAQKKWKLTWNREFFLRSCRMYSKDLRQMGANETEITSPQPLYWDLMGLLFPIALEEMFHPGPCWIHVSFAPNSCGALKFDISPNKWLMVSYRSHKSLFLVSCNHFLQENLQSHKKMWWVL